MRKIMFILPLLLLIISIPYIIQAEDRDEQISTVTLTIMPASKLSITDQNVEKSIEMGAEARDGFGIGFVELPSNKPTLTLDSNESWKLSARATSFTGPYDKPVADLMLKDLASKHVTNGFNIYQSLSISDQEVASYNKGVKSEAHPCQYKVLLDWEKDVPGTSSATVTYTLTTNAS
ncbi:MAG: hypothetical protein Q8N76_05515 [Candidatus Omnitrophota bacterium]|nr:hypothetical protein [Candidatus Omnitrophota bacterium]